MKGGYTKTQHQGIEAEIRDQLFAQISTFGEGEIFSKSDLDLTSEQETVFNGMKSFDYIQISSDQFVSIVETDFLRRLPHIKHLLDSYINRHNCKLRETGDRTAWRMRMKMWEPIKGYRFYSSSKTDVLSFSHMKIQFTKAPEWVFDEDIIGPVAMSLIDTCIEKDAVREATEWARTRSSWREEVSEARDQIISLTQNEIFAIEDPDRFPDFKPDMQAAIDHADLILKTKQ